MNDLIDILESHIERYPKMQIIDAVKLMYQNEFGSGHFISDEASSLRYLRDECAETPINDRELMFEDIGNGIYRLNLSQLKKTNVPLEVINKIFVRSSNEHKGDLENFIRNLRSLYEFGFDKREVNEFLEGYKNTNYPIVSHSDIYKKNYKPAYRLITRRYKDLFEIFIKISEKLSVKSPIIIGIDGKCGAGKTTLTAILSEIYGCDVIETDDFFLPSDLRTDERLDEPGGNIHYERFIDEVKNKIKSDEPFAYRKFDCSVMDYRGEKIIRKLPRKLIIIEGSYSLHEKYSDIYDIKIFIDTALETQYERILMRSGEKLFERFKNVWIPMENKYFTEFKIMENCDIIINN